MICFTQRSNGYGRLGMTDSDETYGGRTPVAVGKRLKLVREVMGLKQIEFARRVGLAPNTYNQLEGGRNFPSIDTLHKLCDTYDLDMNWLLAGDPASLKHNLADALHQTHRLRQTKT